MIEVWALWIILTCTVIGAFGSLCFKLGSKTLSFKIKELLKNYYLIIGVILYGISAILYSVALKGGELSIIYPLVAVSYIWVAIISKYILKEKIGMYKWMGILAIVIGIGFMGLGI